MTSNCPKFHNIFMYFETMFHTLKSPQSRSASSCVSTKFLHNRSITTYRYLFPIHNLGSFPPSSSLHPIGQSWQLVEKVDNKMVVWRWSETIEVSSWKQMRWKASGKRECSMTWSEFRGHGKDIVAVRVSLDNRSNSLVHPPFLISSKVLWHVHKTIIDDVYVIVKKWIQNCKKIYK